MEATDRLARSHNSQLGEREIELQKADETEETPDSLEPESSTQMSIDSSTSDSDSESTNNEEVTLVSVTLGSSKPGSSKQVAIEIDDTETEMTEVDSPGPRTRRSGRTARRNYTVQDQLSEAQISEDADTEIKLFELREHANRLGFETLFDVAMATARSERSGNREDTKEFIESGESHKFFKECHGFAPVVCETTPADVYREEWQKIASHPDFKTTQANITPESLNMFSFTKTYDTMKNLAPKLMELLDFMSNDESDSQEPVDENERREKARRRQLVMALSIFANLSSRRFNVVQAPLCFFFHGKMVSRKVHQVLCQLGITTGYCMANRLGDDAWQVKMETIVANKFREEFGI